MKDNQTKDAARIKWHRPTNDKDFKIDSKIKDILSYSVLFSCSKYTAVERLCSEYLDSSGHISDNGKTYAEQVFALPENKRYIKSMRETLSGISKGLYNPDESEIKIDISDKRKEEALKSLLDQAIGLVEKGTNLEPDALKTVSEIFKKVGLLKDEVEEVEKPRRYLPERCSSCEYKKFIDAHVESCDIEVV